MPKGYTTKQKIENYLLIDIDSSFDNQIDEWIEDIERYIENQTDRVFVADDTASARLYDGNSANLLMIDDCVSITKLEQGDGNMYAPSISWTELTKDTDFVTYPANELPLTRLRRYAQVFYRGMQNIRVTAKWGYSAEPPADIVTAATVLVAGIINYAYKDEGEIKQMTIGRYSVTYKDEKQWQDFERIEKILEYYQRVDF